MILLDGWDALFRDGLCLMFVFNGIGKKEQTRVRALSALWALAIACAGLYEYVQVDPKRVQYLGGEYQYWVVHDTAGAAFHLSLICAWLRPNFQRRQAKTIFFSVFMFVIYVFFTLGVIGEMRKFGTGNCISVMS
jgi:hypothetical protein